MDKETAIQLVSLLESIDSKLDVLTELETRLSSVESYIADIKMDLCGFTHQGKTYPGKLDSLESGLSQIESEIRSLGMTLDSIDLNTSS